MSLKDSVTVTVTVLQSFLILRPFEPEDSGDTKTPIDRIPDQSCGQGGEGGGDRREGGSATQGVEFRALWLQSSSGDHSAARVHGHILSDVSHYDGKL